jgi:hypothetical protein
MDSNTPNPTPSSPTFRSTDIKPLKPIAFKEKPPSKFTNFTPKINKLFSSKIFRILIIVIPALIILIIATIFIINYIQHADDITIGDTTLTPEDFQTYQSAMETYQQENPYVTFGDDLKKVAEDDLILNAALKYYTKPEKCNIKVTPSDILEGSGYTPGSDPSFDMDSQFGDFSYSNVIRIRAENRTFKDKLAPCIINKKEIFMMDINYDTPYFNTLPEDKLAAAYQAAKDRLSNEILPLFEANKSKAEIIKSADLNYISEPYDQEKSYNLYLTQPVLVAYEFTADSEFSPNDMDIDYAISPGDLVSLKSTVNDLTEVGQHTGLILSKTGQFLVARLESKTGLYNTWEDFIQAAKNNFPDQ